MQYKDFLENLADDLQDEFRRRSMFINIDVIEMSKPGGIQLGLQIDDGRNLKPVFYAQSFYEAYEAGEPYFLHFYKFTEDILNALMKMPKDIKIDLLKITDSVSIQVVSTEHAKEYLKGKVYREIEDLAIIYRFHLDDIDRNGSVAVTEEHLKLLQMTEQELYEMAMEKAPLNEPCVIRSMREVIAELEPDRAMFIPESPLMVVTNESGCLGASTLFYPGIMERCADAMNGDFFILPSSQHECLIYPDSNLVNLEQLKEIVKAVNDTKLLPEELLSYNVYHYDYKEKVFELADEYEKRVKDKAIQSLRERLGIKKQEVVKSGHIRKNQDIGSRKIQGGNPCL